MSVIAISMKVGRYGFMNKCIAVRQSLNCIKTPKNMPKNDFQYAGLNSYTMQCGTITTLISSGDCTVQCGMWLYNRDSEFTKWQHPAIRGSGITCLKTELLERSYNWLRACQTTLLLRDSLSLSRSFLLWPQPWSLSTIGLMLLWHSFLIIIIMPLNSPKRPPYWNSTSGFHFHTSPQSTCHSVPVCEILSKSDHPRQKKMTSCRFSRWRISAILDFRGPVMGSFKSPCATSYIVNRHRSFKLLSFWENSVFVHFGDRQTDRLTH